MGCLPRGNSKSYGEVLSWTTDDRALKIADGFVKSHELDWKIQKIHKTENGWEYIYITPEDESMVLGPRTVFVRCDGGSVEFGIRG